MRSWPVAMLASALGVMWYDRRRSHVHRTLLAMQRRIALLPEQPLCVFLTEDGEQLFTGILALAVVGKGGSPLAVPVMEAQPVSVIEMGAKPPQMATQALHDVWGWIWEAVHHPPNRVRIGFASPVLYSAAATRKELALCATQAMIAQYGE